MFKPNTDDALNFKAQQLVHGMNSQLLGNSGLVPLRRFNNGTTVYTETVQHSEQIEGALVFFTCLHNPLGQVVPGTEWSPSDIQAAIT